ncbi:MAG: tRNA preQ1(34) S-adenosylmethionine ribosyltransferase-isomerase QueA, partial [Planctomycetota bacterium]
RTQSRLLVLNRTSGRLLDSRFDRLGHFLSDGDCLVLNDTKVLPARFFARRTTGAKLEALFLAETPAGLWNVFLKGSAKLKTSESIRLSDKNKQDFCSAEVVQKLPDGRCLLRLQTDQNPQHVLNQIGFPPLPPYIKRGDDPAQAAIDRISYQTVYARRSGAVAAPTAGLHFTHGLIEQLKQKGIRFAIVTLHVGPGTFKPITTPKLEEHKMEAEHCTIDEENAAIINTAKEEGHRIIAVGTTTVRTLETMTTAQRINPGSRETSLFITPGYRFKLVDAIVTNFHLPRSTLLALVAAFYGLETILAAYRHAVNLRYRFYSYGDAMLIL